MKEVNIISLLAKMEDDYNYDDDIVFSKFVKKYGEDYSENDFLKFLKRRYEVINKFNASDDFKFK